MLRRRPNRRRVSTTVSDIFGHFHLFARFTVAFRRIRSEFSEFEKTGAVRVPTNNARRFLDTGPTKPDITEVRSLLFHTTDAGGRRPIAACGLQQSEDIAMDRRGLVRDEVLLSLSDPGESGWPQSLRRLQLGGGFRTHVHFEQLRSLRDRIHRRVLSRVGS